MVKHSFQATRRRGKRQPAQCQYSARRLSLLSGPKAIPAPGRSRRERHGQWRGGGQEGLCGGQRCPAPTPGRRGRRSTPGFPGPSSWASGRGLQIRPGDQPGQQGELSGRNPQPASGRGSQTFSDWKVVLTAAGARPEEERAYPFSAARCCFPHLRLPLADALGPSPTATEHMAMFWLIGLDRFVVCLSFSFNFFFLPSKMCRS